MIDRRIGVLSIAIAFSAALGAAEAAHGQGSRPQPNPTRADLAASYLAFEEAFAGASLTGLAQRQVHRGFDYAASLFFSGRLGEAVERLNELTMSVERHGTEGEIDLAAAAAVHSLQVQFSPPVLVANEFARGVRGARGAPRARIRSMYPVRSADGRTIDVLLRLVDSSDNTVWQREVALAFERSMTQRIIELDDLGEDVPEGTHRAVIAVAGSPLPPRTVGRFILAGEPIAARRQALLARLNGETSGHANDAADADGELLRAAAICRARIQVLTDQPSPLNSIEFLLDPIAHASELDAEIDALAAGRNPYRNRQGEHWRVVARARAAGDSPMMVYAPKAVEAEKPLPLVIALHGAGGDETLFMRAYGAGTIRDLAESRGFVVASPLTYHVLADGSLVDRIIDDLSADYAIDHDRVYLIGHSLGGGTATALLASRPERFAAAVCIAGAGPFASPNADAAYPPALVIAAELDTIITPQRLRAFAEAGIERGLPVEFRLEENLGHVLVVNEVLEEAVDWLLLHRAR